MADRIRLVTDTTAVLPPGYAASHHIEVVPQVVLFGDESYLEETELTYDAFLRRLKACATLPQTAAPPPGLFIEAFARQLAEADTIICLHPSTEVSGTVRSALAAKDENYPGADIRVVDTRTIAGNLASLVMLTARWVEGGMGAGEIVKRLEAMIPRGRTYFLVATLEYLQKGGRIGGAAALVGGMLQIKPILELRNGRVEALERVRTHHQALARLKRLVLDQCPPSPEARLGVMQAAAADEARQLAEDLRTALGLREVPIFGLGAAITTHAGPGTLGVGFFV